MQYLRNAGSKLGAARLVILALVVAALGTGAFLVRGTAEAGPPSPSSASGGLADPAQIVCPGGGINGERRRSDRVRRFGERRAQ